MESFLEGIVLALLATLDDDVGVVRVVIERIALHVLHQLTKLFHGVRLPDLQDFFDLGKPNTIAHVLRIFLFE